MLTLLVLFVAGVVGVLLASAPGVVIAALALFRLIGRRPA